MLRIARYRVWGKRAVFYDRYKSQTLLSISAVFLRISKGSNLRVFYSLVFRPNIPRTLPPQTAARFGERLFRLYGLPRGKNDIFACAAIYLPANFFLPTDRSVNCFCPPKCGTPPFRMYGRAVRLFSFSFFPWALLSSLRQAVLLPLRANLPRFPPI